MSNSGMTSLWEHVNSCLTGSWRRVGWFFKWAEGGDIGGSSQRSGLGGLLTPSLRRGSWFVAFWNLIAHNCRIPTRIRLFWAPYSLPEATSVCKCKLSRRGFQVPTYLPPLAGKFPASPRAELEPAEATLGGRRATAESWAGSFREERRRWRRWEARTPPSPREPRGAGPAGVARLRTEACAGRVA